VTAGYSKRTLAEKLGIKPGIRIAALAAPPEYAALLGRLPEGATCHSRLSPPDGFIHWFVRDRKDLAANFPRTARALADDGSLWVSWPKQSSGVKSDLNENIIREMGLKEGLVDVKVIAVDDVWSGLRFVRRIVNRQPKGR
jgi:hypothetical protein